MFEGVRMGCKGVGMPYMSGMGMGCEGVATHSKGHGNGSQRHSHMFKGVRMGCKGVGSHVQRHENAFKSMGRPNL